MRVAVRLQNSAKGPQINSGSRTEIPVRQPLEAQSLVQVVRGHHCRGAVCDDESLAGALGLGQARADQISTHPLAAVLRVDAEHAETGGFGFVAWSIELGPGRRRSGDERDAADEIARDLGSHEHLRIDRGGPVAHSSKFRQVGGVFVADGSIGSDKNLCRGVEFGGPDRSDQHGPSVAAMSGETSTPWAPEPVAPRVVQVLMEGAAVGRPFSYLVPPALNADVQVGSMVRVTLAGRRDVGWVVSEGRVDGDIDDADLREIASVASWGPPAAVVELGEWVAHRWAGRRATVLGSASPDRRVTQLRSGSRKPVEHAGSSEVVGEAWARAVDHGVATLRIAPGAPVVDVVAEICARAGSIALIATPLLRQVGRLHSALGQGAARVPDEWARVRAGACVAVVGSRNAALAPVPDGELAAVIVVAEGDEALQETRVPTWHAREVAVERARRAGVPCVLLSAAPSVEALRAGPVVGWPLREERGGWPVVEVVDLREADPARGRYPEEVVRALHTSGRAVVVAQLTGRLRALVCRSCGEVARCGSCGSAVALEGIDLACRRCQTRRGAFCLGCGSVALRPWRVGVSRLREELEALLGEEVGEVVAGKSQRGDARVVVGTEAVLSGAWRGVDRVVLLDFDHVLLAPAARAGERAIHLIARATRLVGARARGQGRVLVATRAPAHPVVVGAVGGDVSGLAEQEWQTRADFGLVPARAVALLSGPGSVEYAHALQALLAEDDTDDTEVVGRADGSALVVARDPDRLADVLASVGRPAARMRVEVEPYWF